MAGAGPKPAVIINSSGFDRGKRLKDPRFIRLLEDCQASRIDIFISHVTMEEVRTQLVEDALKGMTRGRKEITDALRQSVLGDGIQIRDEDIRLPSEDALIEQSHMQIQRLVDTYRLQVLRPTMEEYDQHQKNYFAGGPAFSSPKSREDLPDGLIYLAAERIFRERGHLTCLCKDGGLHDALKTLGAEMYRDYRSLLDALKPIGVVPPAPVAGAPTLADVLSVIAAGSRTLYIRILGYVEALAPVSRTDLEPMLARRSHSPAAIETALQALVDQGALRSTGNSYVPLDRRASQEAAAEIVAEIAEILEQ